MLVLVFARAKTGKTLDAALSFPKARFLCYAPAGLHGAFTLYGHRPVSVHTPTFQDVTAALRAGCPEDCVVIDDLTLMAAATEKRVQKEHADAKGQNTWNYVRQVARDMLQAARHAQKVVVLNGHEREARTNYVGTFVRGGIDLPMQLTEVFTAEVDFAARGMTLDPDTHGFDLVHKHKGIYWGPAGSSSWATGNRLGLEVDAMPMNLGEILRSSGLYDAPRVAPWVEKVVVLTAEALAPLTTIGKDHAHKFEDRRKLLRETRDRLLAQNVPVAHAIWALRDAEDRALIYKLKANLATVYDGES